MNPSGAVLVIVGVWILTQVLRGHALERLGAIEAKPLSGSGN